MAHDVTGFAVWYLNLVVAATCRCRKRKVQAKERLCIFVASRILDGKGVEGYLEEDRSGLCVNTQKTYRRMRGHLKWASGVVCFEISGI